MAERTNKVVNHQHKKKLKLNFLTMSVSSEKCKGGTKYVPKQILVERHIEEHVSRKVMHTLYANRQIRLKP